MIFKKQAYIIVVLAAICLQVASAQQKDFQLRTGVGLTHELPFDVDGSLEIQQRFRENSSQYDRTLASVGLGYNLVKGLKLSLGYRFVYLKTDELEFTHKYRLNTDLRYKREVFGLDFKIRTRLQYGYDQGYLSTDYDDQKLVSRNLIGVSYKLPQTRFTPYLSYEFFTHLNDEEGANFYQTRLQAGCTVKLSRKSDLDVYYILEDEFNVVDPWQSNILGVSFQYNF